METIEPLACVRLKISGRVQGVYFRASTVQQARRLMLTGWVKNSPDGSVEALAEGARANIEELLAWCHHGPPGAQVERVDAEWKAPMNEFQSFHIRH